MNGKIKKYSDMNNLNNLLNDGSADLMVMVKASDLKTFAASLIEQAKSHLKETIEEEKAERYLSPAQVSEMLGVNITTLWRWANKNYLVPLEVGGKRRYRMSEVKALLNQKKGAASNAR